MEEQKSNGLCLTSPGGIQKNIHVRIGGQFTPTQFGANLLHFKPVEVGGSSSVEEAWIPLRTCTPPTLPEISASLYRAARRKKIIDSFHFENCPDDSNLPQKQSHQIMATININRTEGDDEAQIESNTKIPCKPAQDVTTDSIKHKQKTKSPFKQNLSDNIFQIKVTPFEEDDLRKSDNKMLSNEEKTIQEHQQQCSFKKLSVIKPQVQFSVMESKQKFFKDLRLFTRKAHLSQSIPPKTTLSMILSKEYNIMGFLWPEFHLRLANDAAPIMAAKRTSIKPHPTYIISAKTDDFEENSLAYLGKLKANLDGTVVNLFGPGLAPSSAARQHEIPRELLATIVFGQVEKNTPRSFSVFVKKQDIHYYLAFPQVKLYDPEVPLHELYKNPANKDKIQVYSSRLPTRDSQSQTYLLDLGGLAKCSSPKNFILQGQSGTTAAIFGKSEENLFKYELCSPLSALVGFGVALCGFHPFWF